MEYYLELTNPKLDRLFQRPQRKSKSFDIHRFDTKVLYENAPIGSNMVSKMLKLLLKAAGQPAQYTNHCIRATSITNLKNLGFEDRAIMNLSGKGFLFLNFK